MTSLNRKLLRDLRHLNSQVIAVMLVVACGMATYITMRSAYESLVVSQADYYREYRFAEVFAQVKRAPETLVPRLVAIPGVSRVETRVVFEVALDVPGLEEPATGRLVSIPENNRPLLNDLFLRRGRYIEPRQRDEVIVSEAFADANGLKIGDRLGAVLNGRWQRLRIVGVAISPEYVYEIRGIEVFPDNRRFGVLWMSREVLGPVFDFKGGFNDLALALSPGANEAEVISRVDTLLENHGGLGAFGRDEHLSHRFLSDEIKQDRVTGIFIPSIFLGIAAFLIHIILSRIIILQRPQIAVLKAFGYGRWAIGWHYLQFALVIVAGGALLGVAAGIWLGTRLADLYARFFHFPQLRFELTPFMIGTALLISGGSACLGAWTAVRKATALPPAEAMRPEPPARFQTGWLERLGLQRFFHPSFRMILRHLARKKMKALMSIFGIAWAVAILVVGFYSFDAIDYIMRVQFEEIQREDATVLFHDPRPARVRHEVNRLPGVLYSETFRVVPVRLRYGHRSKRLGIFGLYPDGRLRSLMDSRFQPVPLPSAGLVLNTKLAEILGVATGDVLQVEVLEGRRPIRSLVVSTLVDELIGLAAYMDIRALHRLLEEEPAVSGAYLSVDPLQANRLYARLKQTPAVGGVGVREAMLESFSKTIAENMAISTTMLIAFACIIAFGLVYNGARIALSERGNELASLRVLGFTRREVTFLLLGEQALLTLLAIPLGWLLGWGVSALMVRAIESELYRLPLVISGRTYGLAFIIVAASAFVSGLFVRRRIRNLDLVAVLKTRE
ncbi:MAG: FtsX-like permease family protein [Deltaproteobacteria bacterium]|nr:FtsX-like permease family protein [Deltaproteobacteria bacterium]